MDANPGDGHAADNAGRCTLELPIQEANASAGEFTIILDVGTYTLTLAGTDEDAAATGDLDISGEISIVGVGADQTLVGAAQLDRVFDVHSSAALELSGISLTGGSVSGPENGGGVRNLGELTVTGSMVSSNFTGNDGGGIHNEGTLTITDTTVCDNLADRDGGGIHNDATTTIENSTFSGNSAANHGGAVHNSPSGSLSLSNVTATDNSAGGVNDVPGLEPVGPEFRINTSTTDMQVGPNVAIDGDGNFIVIWNSDHFAPSSYYAFAQRYDRSGMPIDGEFMLSPWNSLGGPVGMDAAGNFVAIYGGQDSDNSGVNAQRFQADATPLGEPFVANSPENDKQSWGRIAVVPDGRFVIAWMDWDGNDGDVYGVFAQSFNASGEGQGGFQVNTTTDYYQRYPSVAADSVGNFVIVWQDYGSGGASGIYGQRYTSLGQPLGGEFRIDMASPDTYHAYPTVAMDDGGFVVTWLRSEPLGSGDFEAFARRYDALGSALGDAFQVSSWSTSGPDAYANRPCATIVSESGFVICWGIRLPDNTTDVFARHYDANGIAQGPEVRVNSTTVGDQYAHQMASGSHGEVIIVWTGNGPGDDFGSFGQRFAITDHDGGGVFNATGGVVNATNSIIAGNAAGNSSPDVSGAFTSLGHNLIGDSGDAVGFTHGLNGDQVGNYGSEIDPLLGPLNDNGGRTLTHALLPGSPCA